ncbi:ATP-binding protein [Phyllobacterium myrsinacearum]|uniref:histidine kinase n=1 Tax=Phyllobacterium myrsinacearum TaxID=28101 RepID=A0A839EJD3_9HYPH|nr:ATP-binding protein [Phyllobacterium myrsinacearum]MBA8880101.1 signal transduction histidine kinase [Phyllobacterium myrsinacearum]
MNSLRNRIALLLFLAIVTVVLLATLTAVTVLRGPPPEAVLSPVIQRIAPIIRTIEANPASAASQEFAVRPMQAAGFDDRRLSGMFMRELGQAGLVRTVLVTRNAGRQGLAASIRLETGMWLIVDVPDMTPHTWWILTGWITLITLGSTAVAVFAASKITKPLLLLDNAVTAVRADGTLPHVPETGSQEVRATAQTINRLSERLKTATESRMRLIAAAGHDMRTPMTRMRLRAEFLPDDPDRQKWLNDLEELNNIADSAISLVREETVKDTFGSTRLDLTIQEIAEELSSMDMKVNVQGLAPLSIAASPLALKRALRNLIINGATHGNGADIAVEQRQRTAVITIKDNGPGIPPELLDKVFEPFFRADKSRRKTVFGAGLGLAIAKEIIERFGGTVIITNRKPSGLLQTVSFTIETLSQA